VTGWQDGPYDSCAKQASASTVEKKPAAAPSKLAEPVAGTNIITLEEALRGDTAKTEDQRRATAVAPQQGNNNKPAAVAKNPVTKSASVAKKSGAAVDASPPGAVGACGGCCTCSFQSKHKPHTTPIPSCRHPTMLSTPQLAH
jgi:hypothetical protein